MGHEIVYCFRCATRLLGADFDRGKAFRAGGKIVCAACLPEVVPGLTPQEQQEVAPLSSTKMKTVKSSPSASSHGTSVRLVAQPGHAPEEKSSLPMILAVLGVVTVLGIAAAVMSGRSAPPPPEKTVTIVKPPTRPPEEKTEDPQIREARAAMDAAREKMKSAPQDLDAQLAAWEEAVRKAALTPFHREAATALNEIRVKREAVKPPPPPPDEKKPVVRVDPPPVKTPDVDFKPYLTRWDAAMAKAAGRDFDGAVADLGRAAAELTDDVLKKEARADGDLLGAARTQLAEGKAAISRLARGQAIQLRVRGEQQIVAGTVVRAAAGRAEIRQGEGSVFVESEDVSAASLAAVLRAEGKDRVAWAVLCLLEGDREAAEALAGTDGLAARYWEFTGGKAPKATPRELEARSRFYAAEREFAKVETLAAAVAKYKSLADDYADTRVVKDESARIQKRAQAGRDYVYVAGAIRAKGTFAMTSVPRTEVAWVSKEDIDGAQALENYVEVEFAALPETTYRCWALVAGCCAETFVFYLQTTEGTELHPKTRQKTSIDPGAGLAALVKHSITGLKKMHEDHKVKGAKVHPKTPARWEWVSIPLPKYSAAGAKKIRLMSDQQGFGVGAVVVSSTRTSFLPEAELKEEVARVRTTVAAADPGLVGWWRLDEGGGSAVLDAVEGGHPGTVVGKPKWVAGKVGGGMKFDTGDYVEIKGPFSMSAITLAAWVKHDSTTGEIQRYVTFGDEVAVIRCQVGAAHLYMRTNGDLREVLVSGGVEAGKWMHIAGTWDGQTMRLYRDGVQIGSATPGGKLSGAMDKVLLSFPNEPIRGVLDEPRLYDRALSDAEVKKLFEEGSSGTIAEINATPPPPPPGKPWRPLLAGDCIKPSNSWKNENGALAFIPGTDDAAQTREAFGDGELRIRFEVKDAERFWFCFRQSGPGGYGVAFDNELKSLEGKPHELVFIAAGDKVTATLDGKPVPVSVTAVNKSGCLQFNGRGRVIRILAIDVR